MDAKVLDSSQAGTQRSELGSVDPGSDVLKRLLKCSELGQSFDAESVLTELLQWARNGATERSSAEMAYRTGLAAECGQALIHANPQNATLGVFEQYNQLVARIFSEVSASDLGSLKILEVLSSVLCVRFGAAFAKHLFTCAESHFAEKSENASALLLAFVAGLARSIGRVDDAVSIFAQLGYTHSEPALLTRIVDEYFPTTPTVELLKTLLYKCTNLGDDARRKDAEVRAVAFFSRRNDDITAGRLSKELMRLVIHALGWKWTYDAIVAPHAFVMAHSSSEADACFGLCVTTAAGIWQQRGIDEVGGYDAGAVATKRIAFFVKSFESDERPLVRWRAVEYSSALDAEHDRLVKCGSEEQKVVSS